MNPCIRLVDACRTTVIVALAIGGALSAARAADLDHAYGFRRHHHRSVYAHRPVAYAPTCGFYEPSDYKPRITNFDEPLCYAARPYGLSAHLYDYSLEARARD